MGKVIKKICMRIGAVILWKSATDEGYNRLYNSRWTKVLRHESDHPTPLETLYSAFADMNTPLGKPYLGKANWLHKHCLIFGSPKEHAHMYAYTNRSERTLYLFTNAFPLCPLTLHGELLSSRALAEEIFRVLVQYTEDGTVELIDDAWLLYTAAPPPEGYEPPQEDDAAFNEDEDEYEIGDEDEYADGEDATLSDEDEAAFDEDEDEYEFEDGDEYAGDEDADGTTDDPNGFYRGSGAHA